MMTLPIGAIGMLGVLIFALSTANIATFFNSHSLILVVGGTICVLGLATPFAELKSLLRALFQLFQRMENVSALNPQLLQLTKNRGASLGANVHPLIGYAQSLWEQGVDAEMFSVLLNQRLEELVHIDERAIAAMRNLAKYPPALGMTGTVIGLVSLFSKLTPDAQLNLGPSLALAMTATFYGLILSNAFLMPIADRLYVRHLAKMRNEDHVFRALMLIHRGTTQSLIEEKFHVAEAA